MEEVDADDYLGDVVANDGKNNKNLQKRLACGMGQISQVMNLLDLVSFGQHYVEQSITFFKTVWEANFNIRLVCRG